MLPCSRLLSTDYKMNIVPCHCLADNGSPEGESPSFMDLHRTIILCLWLGHGEVFMGFFFS